MPILKILPLRTLISSHNCVYLIEVLFMERREFNEPHIYNSFANIINLNFNLNSLSFLLFLTKFINFFFKQLNEIVYLKNFHSSSKLLHFLYPTHQDFKTITNSLYLGNHNLTYIIESGWCLLEMVELWHGQSVRQDSLRPSLKLLVGLLRSSERIWCHWDDHLLWI